MQNVQDNTNLKAIEDEAVRMAAELSPELAETLSKIPAVTGGISGTKAAVIGAVSGVITNGVIQMAMDKFDMVSTIQSVGGGLVGGAASYLVNKNFAGAPAEVATINAISIGATAGIATMTLAKAITNGVNKVSDMLAKEDDIFEQEDVVLPEVAAPDMY